MDHEITVRDIRHVEQEMEFTGDVLTDGEIIHTNTTDNSIRTFSCSCGEDDMNYQEAVEHMKTAFDRVTPETFEKVARKLFNGESIPSGQRENGFVLRNLSKAIVGMEKDDTHIVAIMRRREETRGQNDHRMKTRQATYVKAQFYEVSLSGVPMERKAIKNKCSEDGKKLTRGYVNGYMTTPIDNALDEIFKYYAR